MGLPSASSIGNLFSHLPPPKPLVDAHEKFLSELTATQKELVQAMNEQTRLLYTIQPRTAQYGPHDDTPQN
jgi:hypothetical protein